MMGSYTITVAREFGSQGRRIAKRLSEILGVNYYDREIVEEAARKLGLPETTISSKEEKTNHNLLYRMFPLGTDDEYIQNQIFEAQRELILEFADKGSCVIVGRCSDYLLENRENNLSVYIYAPFEQRIENCVNNFGMEPHEAERSIETVDRARRAYHKRYAGYFPEELAHHQLCVDSSVLDVEGTAALIADFARRRFGV